MREEQARPGSGKVPSPPSTAAALGQLARDAAQRRRNVSTSASTTSTAQRGGSRLFHFDAVAEGVPATTTFTVATSDTQGKVSLVVQVTVPHDTDDGHEANAVAVVDVGSIRGSNLAAPARSYAFPCLVPPNTPIGLALTWGTAPGETDFGEPASFTVEVQADRPGASISV